MSSWGSMRKQLNPAVLAAREEQKRRGRAAAFEKLREDYRNRPSFSCGCTQLEIQLLLRLEAEQAKAEQASREADNRRHAC